MSVHWSFKKAGGYLDPTVRKPAVTDPGFSLVMRGCQTSPGFVMGSSSRAPSLKQNENAHPGHMDNQELMMWSTDSQWPGYSISHEFPFEFYLLR